MTDINFSPTEIIGRVSKAEKKRKEPFAGRSKKESPAGGLSLKEGLKEKEEVKGSAPGGLVLKKKVSLEPLLKKLKLPPGSDKKALSMLVGCESHTRYAV